MPKAFDKIMDGLNDALAHAEGRANIKEYRVNVPAEVDVKAIRTAQKLTQNEFAATYGFTPSAVKEWEQNRRTPEASARVLLKVIERNPEAVREALMA